MTHFFHGLRKPKAGAADEAGNTKSRAWIEQRGRDFHPAFAVESKYDELQERYVPTELATIRCDLLSMGLFQDLMRSQRFGKSSQTT